jgi:hypothetical protein
MSQNSQTLDPHKPGDTFSWSGFWPDVLPTGVTWGGKCYARDAEGALVQDFTVTLTPPVSPDTLHAIRIRAESDETVNWPAGAILKSDIRLHDNSTPPVKTTTHTFVIKTVQAITNV